MTEVLITVDNLSSFIDESGEIPDKVRTAAVRSINKTLDKSRAESARSARNQINFPASYLSPSGGRIKVGYRASNHNLYGYVDARDSATSLSRFVNNRSNLLKSTKNKPKLRVRVKANGNLKDIDNAFLMKLGNDNIGLAVRTNGHSPRRAYKPKMLSNSLWLLYGPSVDQVLLQATSGNGVYRDISSDMANFLNYEFNRQLALLGVLDE